MVLLISPEQNIDQELVTLHKLFDAGLTHYHFRKPFFDLQEHRAYVEAIDPQYHNRIVTHNFHEALCTDFHLKGIHLEEAVWRAQGQHLEAYVATFRKKDVSISSSYHEPADLIAQNAVFDYTILSPVFAAISKSGMQGRGFDVREIQTFVAGMGGINAETTPQAVALGFKGVGALGGVWNAQEPVVAFKEMRAAFDKALSQV